MKAVANKRHNMNMMTAHALQPAGQQTIKLMQDLIESFINGNISSAKPKLKRRSHRELRQAYQDATGCGDEKATAFADFIKGDISFQHYCDIKY